MLWNFQMQAPAKKRFDEISRREYDVIFDDR